MQMLFFIRKVPVLCLPINDVVVCAARKNCLSYDMVTKYTFLSHVSAYSSSSRPPELGSTGRLIKNVELNWFRRRTYQALNILKYVRHMISSMSELGLRLIRFSSLAQSELCRTLIWVFINTDAGTAKIVTTVNDSSVTMSTWSSARM